MGNAVSNAVQHGLCWLFGVLLLLGIAGCNKGLPSAESGIKQVSAAPLPAPSAEALDVQFLGAGGVYLRLGDQALLGDPFFSNPPLWDWLPWRTLLTRPEVVEAHLPPLENLQGVLVGHTHFDHALDIPYVAAKLPAGTRIYGNETLPNLLATEVAAQRLVDVSVHMAKAGEGGQWVYLNPRLRMLPIYSEHAPHAGSSVLASQRILQPVTQAPLSALDWDSGTNLNYVIDFLDADEQVSYRIFYQSSASSAPIGFPPRWVLQDGVPFDLALLCAANYDHVTHYPQGILQQIQPRQLMLIHWERFWDEYDTQSATPLPGLDFSKLETAIRTVLDADVPVWLPMRTASIRVRH